MPSRCHGRGGVTQCPAVRLLAVTDLHYRLPHYDWLLHTAAEADAVSISGDLLDIATPVPVEAQAAVVGAYLTRMADVTMLLASSGNHDLDGPGANGEQTAGWLRRVEAPGMHTDGESVDVDGLRVTIAGWWDGPSSQADVAAQLQAAAVARPERWVWIYHSPPAGTRLCFDGRRSFPDESLAGWIDQHEPDLVLCGHIHQAPWVEGGGWYDRLGRTLVVNPGKQIGKIPPHVWLDTDTGSARWYGLGEYDDVQMW
jgi:Icc-related predicted phosphoesterase